MGEDRRKLLRGLVQGPPRIAAAARAAGRQRAGEGQWGAREHVLHLIAVEEVIWHRRLREVAETELPEWTWTEPGPAAGFDEATLDEVLTEFADRRAATLAHLDALDEAGWKRAGRHETFGLLDVAGLVREAVRHDEHHLADLDHLAILAEPRAQG